MKAQVYNDLLHGDQYHNDEMHAEGLVFSGSNSPHYVIVDYTAVAERNHRYLLTNIAREKAYQERKREKEAA